MTMKFPVLAGILACMLITAGCMTMPTPTPLPTETGSSLAHQYGEEVLAYMMQVVLGKAGDPDKRAKWNSRGVNQDLDIERIAGIMSDPEANKTTLIVNDPSILGLSKVLYHYAPEMSQFTGSYGTSLYPATELVALRLFLLKRIQANRKVSIQALIDHQRVLKDPQQLPTQAELTATNLNLKEFRLLQATFNAKPWLFNCLTNPFLVEAFSRAGVLENDPLTARLISRAHYRDTPCTPMDTRSGRKSVVVAFLPSMTKEFIPGVSGFNPTESYSAAVENLKTEILAAYHRTAMEALDQHPSVSADQADPDFEKRRDHRLNESVAFRSLNTRPLVIYPDNAAKVIQTTCPNADFVVIILGRNVYQAMHIDPAKDIYPAANRVYLDITDVKYSQVSSEAAEIGRFLYEKMKSRLSTVEAAGKAS